MRIAGFLFLLIALAACGTRQMPVIPRPPADSIVIDTTEDAAIVDTASRDLPLTLAMDWFYLRGSKSSSLEDTAGTAAWLREQLQRIERTGIPRNGHCGPGPNCAEWNPEAADLLIVATTPHALDRPSLSVKLNGQSFDPGTIEWKNVSGKNGALVWFILPAKEQNKRMRAVQPGDYASLYGERLSDSATFLAPLNVGKVLDIALTIGSKDKKQAPLNPHVFFHAAYGE
jgi:hypothetical protein